MDDVELAHSAIVAGGAGIIGRLLYWAHSDRHPIGWSLLWELPTALGLGWVGLGIGEWLGFGQNATIGVAIVVSYVGPRIIDILLLQLSKKYWL